MWSKCPIETAEYWHNEFESKFHKGHNIELGHDLDDDFYYSLSRYKDLGIKDGVEWHLNKMTVSFSYLGLKQQ